MAERSTKFRFQLLQEFRDSAREVADLRLEESIGDEFEGATPGIIYAGGLYLERSSNSSPYDLFLTIGNDTRAFHESQRAEAEEVLFSYGRMAGILE